MNSFDEWLSLSPKYTTFRVNKLMTYDDSKVKNILQEQGAALNACEIPLFYLLRPDCLVVNTWPIELKLSRTNKKVIVDVFCGAAVLRGSHVYAPGVLGLPTNLKLNEQVDIYADLDGKCKRGFKLEFDGRKQYVGTGRLKMLRHELYDNNAQPSGIAIHTIMPDSRLPVLNETLFPKGHVILQNLPSIVCGWVVNAQPNEFILDMCASPGNKTTHLAEMSNNQAIIVALDKTQQKVDRIIQACETQGVTCVKAFAYDSTKCCSETDTNSSSCPPFQSNSFDKVLLDGPCSGLGQRPQLVNRTNPKVLDSYKHVQRKLFTAAVKVLKVGGTLVYSTCTVLIDENEGIVAWALEKFPNLKLLPAEPLLGGPGLPNCGLNDEQRIYFGEPTNALNELVEYTPYTIGPPGVGRASIFLRSMVQRFGPEEDPLRTVEAIYKDTIGFFIAKFTKL